MNTLNRVRKILNELQLVKPALPADQERVKDAMRELERLEQFLSGTDG